MLTKPRRRPPRHPATVASSDAGPAAQGAAAQGLAANGPAAQGTAAAGMGAAGTGGAGTATAVQTTIQPWSIDYGDRDIASASVQLDQSSPVLLLDASQRGVEEGTTDLPENGHRSSKRMPKTEVVGFAMTVAGVLLAMFLLYLYVFSALTASRSQNQLLHSLTSDPVAIFSLASGHEPRNGQPVAILDIPSIGLHQAVVEGTTAADLQMGPGLMTSRGISGVPGEPGDAVIAGRRVSFGGPFGRLSSLQTGSVIQVVDGAGAFKFEVTKVESISQGQLAVPSYGRSWLTLVTSNSPWLPTGRTVVVARIAGQPGGAKGSSSSSESLPSFAGDPAAGVLAALWALAFIFVLGLMVFAIRRWRQTWVSWLLAAPVLLACGLFACESLARCLPSTL
jgi:sortase A